MFCFAGCKKEKERAVSIYQEKIAVLRTELERMQCTHRNLLLEIKRKEEIIQNINKKKRERKKADSAGTSNGKVLTIIDSPKEINE